MGRKIPLKLLVDTKSNRVLFAEAGKEFVDLVFSLLTLPIGGMVRRISATGTMEGSIDRLYKSLLDMNPSYMQPGGARIKLCLLRPKMVHPDARELQVLQGCDGKSSPAKQKLYTCAGHCATATVETKATCPNCGQAMSTVVSFSLTMSAAPRPAAGDEGSSDDSGGGYVKGGMATYFVTDGLEVRPMSAVSSIMLINRFVNASRGEVKLEEKHVSVGSNEVCSGIYIWGCLKLTSVFVFLRC